MKSRIVALLLAGERGRKRGWRLQRGRGHDDTGAGEGKLTLEVAVSHELDGGYLAVELLSHQMKFTEEKQ